VGTKQSGLKALAKGKKPLVVVTRKLPDTVETRMRELFERAAQSRRQAMTQAQLTEAVKVADVLVRRSPTGSMPRC